MLVMTAIFFPSPVGCGVPHHPENGFVQSLDISQGTQQGSEISFSCNTSFVPAGNMTSTCALDGMWNPDPATFACICTFIHCSSLNPLDEEFSTFWLHFLHCWEIATVHFLALAVGWAWECTWYAGAGAVLQCATTLSYPPRMVPSLLLVKYISLRGKDLKRSVHSLKKIVKWNQCIILVTTRWLGEPLSSVTA